MATKRPNRESDMEFFSFQEHTGGGSVPAFLSKLWILVEDPSNSEIICWDQAGTSFHIYDQARFATEVLPYYFKHSNISSFIRQLNMYGFRKVPNMEQGALKTERGDLEFQHPCFVQGHEELLDRIKRKTGQTRSEQRPVSIDSDSLTKVLNEVSQIKNKQETFNTTMEDLKRENQILWREVIKMSKKYQQQQQIINKLMHFLLSLVNQHGMAGISRKRPLMINAPEPAESSQPSPAKKANIVLNEAGDHDYTVQSPMEMPPSVLASSGVIIQELLENLDPSITSVPSPQASSTFRGLSMNPEPSKTPVVSFLNSPTMPDASKSITTEDQEHVFPSLTTGLQEHMSAVMQPTTTATPLPAPSNPTPVVTVRLPTAVPQQQQQMQEMKTECPQVSQQIALMPVKDQPLSSSSSGTSASNSPSAKEISEQMKLLQCDLDSVREVLSSGQFNLDPNFILGLFDPETPFPVNIDSNLMDLLSSSDNTTGLEPHPMQAQLPAISPEAVCGTELLQYQPAEISLPLLFEDLPLEGDNLPVFFEGQDCEGGLHTPAVVDIKPNLTDSCETSAAPNNIDPLLSEDLD